MSRFWIGVASREHVQVAIRGSFCQMNHGKRAPLVKMKRGDFVAYYSPAERFHAGVPLQAFTAIGLIADDDIHQVRLSPTFEPFRRTVRYLQAIDAPIKPLLPLLSFTSGIKNWGQIFRRGHFQVVITDGKIIAEAMGITGAEWTSVMTDYADGETSPPHGMMSVFGLSDHH